uniref:Uncharacterized protein n=1 Tax=Setaria viridis TaxID=4556 RepID=A0A4U6VQF3_SETVI|nr:hypothetical protein SEVIR_2G104400v2 [Setaria viridis]
MIIEQSSHTACRQSQEDNIDIGWMEADRLDSAVTPGGVWLLPWQLPDANSTLLWPKARFGWVGGQPGPGQSRVEEGGAAAPRVRSGSRRKRAGRRRRRARCGGGGGGGKRRGRRGGEVAVESHNRERDGGGGEKERGREGAWGGQ